MLLKTVFLFSVGTVLAHPLQETPADLKEYFQDIDTEVKSLQQATIIQIRSNAVPLETYITNAWENIIQNLTSAARPYWATIRSLQETAEEQGKDISTCVDLGNSQMLTLNNSILNPAQQAFDQYNVTGHEILDASSSEAYSVIQELNVLEEVVALCNDETCATNLQQTVKRYYERTKNTLNDAQAKISNYVVVYLPELLEQYQVDTDLYVSDYTVILDHVFVCVNNI